MNKIFSDYSARYISQLELMILHLRKHIFSAKIHLRYLKKKTSTPLSCLPLTVHFSSAVSQIFLSYWTGRIYNRNSVLVLCSRQHTTLNTLLYKIKEETFSAEYIGHLINVSFQKKEIEPFSNADKVGKEK